MPRTGSSYKPSRLTAPGEVASPEAASAFPPALPFPGSSLAGSVHLPATRRTRALILVGHGSHLNADSSAPVYAHAAAIRASGAFDEVHEAFWKEEPPLTAVLDLAQADDVFIVPLFLSEGYFTREVLPREMGLTAPLMRRDGRSFRYLPPVGTHPAMTEMILRRARAVLGRDAGPRREATLVVIGHGTERSTTSADTVHSLVDRLREAGDFDAVTCGFLDEAPLIGEVIANLRTPEVVLVPFFIAEGWHTRETIPAELGLKGEITRIGDVTLWYTPPVGTLPEMADVILEMTGELDAAGEPSATRLPEVTEESSPQTAGEDHGSATADALDTGDRMTARKAFFAHLAAASEPVRLMDVVIEDVAAGMYRLRHREDLKRDPDTLTAHRDPESALEIGRFRADGSYRPMRSSADLRTGWVFPALDQDGLWRAVARLYPAALDSWFRATDRPPAPGGYRSWSSRQTAMYAEVRKLDFGAVQGVVETLCESCHRTRCWVNDVGEGETAGDSPAKILAGGAGVGTGPGTDGRSLPLVVPCLEPCTMFATCARDRIPREPRENHEG